MSVANQTNAPFLTSDPPHWAARGVAYLLILLFVVVVTAAIVVKAPETVSAPFTLVPKRGADPLRAVRRGVVTEVKAVESQPVKQGDELFIIRSEQTSGQSADLLAEEAKLRSSTEILEIARRKLESQKLANEEERRKLQGRIEYLGRMVELKNRELVVAADVAENYQQLQREGLASLTVLKDRQLEASRLTGQIEQYRNDQRDARAAIDKLGRQEEVERNEFEERERALKEEIERAKIQITLLKQWVSKERSDQFSVRSPCAGSVLKLQIKAAGAVVNEGETLGELNCSAEKLQAELLIPANGAGRVQVGQDVKLLYDSFPYQQFGVKFGSLRWISPSGASSSFRALVEIDDVQIMVFGRPAELRAGMSGRADIVIGRRSLISFVLDPIRQLRENMAATREKK